MLPIVVGLSKVDSSLVPSLSSIANGGKSSPGEEGVPKDDVRIKLAAGIHEVGKHPDMIAPRYSASRIRSGCLFTSLMTCSSLSLRTVSLTY